MPAKYFICPDGIEIEIIECLKNGGCRLKERCATRPYLRLIGFDREYKGVTPSSAGNGPRLIYLKATEDYSVDPNNRVWASIGTGTHGKLSIHKYTRDVLSEEPLSDEKTQGIPDVLEESEIKDGWFDLYDYKTWGSYKLMLALGGDYVPLLNENNEPVLYVRGAKKGQPKKGYKLGVKNPDLLAEELQLNRYRIFFEQYGFPIDKMLIQAIPRDGGTQVARSRLIERNLYILPIRRLDDDFVLHYYNLLQIDVDVAFEINYARLCDEWETWEYRRCKDFCEVSNYCKQMSKEHNEKWGKARG